MNCGYCNRAIVLGEKPYLNRKRHYCDNACYRAHQAAQKAVLDSDRRCVACGEPLVKHVGCAALGQEAESITKFLRRRTCSKACADKVRVGQRGLARADRESAYAKLEHPDAWPVPPHFEDAETRDNAPFRALPPPTQMDVGGSSSIDWG